MCQLTRALYEEFDKCTRGSVDHPHTHSPKLWRYSTTTKKGKIPTSPYGTACHLRKRTTWQVTVLQSLTSEHSSYKGMWVQILNFMPSKKGQGEKKKNKKWFHGHQDHWKEIADEEICQRSNNFLLENLNSQLSMKNIHILGFRPISQCVPFINPPGCYYKIKPKIPTVVCRFYHNDNSAIRANFLLLPINLWK